MKSLVQVGLATLAAIVFSGSVVKTASAAQFEQQEVDQSRYTALAMPLASGHYKLLVLHQISNARPCWSESSSNPVLIDPLLVNFDFTGICGRSTDSNGYSIRVAGEEMALRYSLRLEQRGGEIVLLGKAARDTGLPEMVIGRTYGLAPGFKKIILEPGWRFSRRMFKGKTLGHIYFTNDSLAAATRSVQPPVATGPASSPVDPIPVAPSAGVVQPVIPATNVPPKETPSAVSPVSPIAPTEEKPRRRRRRAAPVQVSPVQPTTPPTSLSVPEQQPTSTQIPIPVPPPASTQSTGLQSPETAPVATPASSGLPQPQSGLQTNLLNPQRPRF